MEGLWQLLASPSVVNIGGLLLAAFLAWVVFTLATKGNERSERNMKECNERAAAVIRDTTERTVRVIEKNTEASHQQSIALEKLSMMVGELRHVIERTS